MSNRLMALSRPFNLASIDKAVVAIVIILLALIVIDATVALDSFKFMVTQIINVSPFLLASIAIAAYAKASGADGLIAKAFQGNVIKMIFVAALMGALSPFCSCGVIPLIAALLFMGVPLSAVMAFWLASPIMDPSMFALTTGVLGTEFALYKTASAIFLGLLGGYGVLALQGTGMFENPLRPGVGDGGCGASNVRAPKEVVWKFWHEAPRRKAFADSGLSNTLFLGKWLMLAFLLESVMLTYVPAQTISGLLGNDGLLTIVTAALVGVPAYLNGYAALPLVSGLIDQGMAPGAGMAFLIAGGVTSIPAAIAVFALARMPVFLAYIGFALTGSVISGLLYTMFA
ncbi:MAG: permease [Hyphomicrobiales bacterium]|nr:permease [Hyphomicrobiales bacterium]